MNTERIEETVSAALDGEPVDVDELRQALATAAGRDALAAFVLLRSATASDVVAPAAKLSVAASEQFSRRRARPRLVARRVVAGALAASVAALAVVGSFWLGSEWRATQVTVQLAPPAAPRSAVAPSPVIIVPAAVRPCAPPPALQPPQPTRVVRYVRGVDWTDATSQ